MLFFVVTWFFAAQVDSITVGSLKGYFNTQEAYQLLDTLGKNHSTWLTKLPNDFYRLTSSESGKKIGILALGGFSGGFPQGNFQILYTVQRLLEDLENQKDLQELFRGVFVDFSVFPNEAAYNKSFVINNNSDDFEVNQVYGDQETYFNSCDSQEDFGINPDMNFPINFFKSGENCYANFTGNSSSECTLTKKFMSDLKNYIAVINYQGSGQYYAGPHAGIANDSESDSAKVFINQIFQTAETIGFSSGSLFEINGKGLNGTFLDFADDKKIAFIQIALGKYGKLTQEDDLLEDAEKNFKIFINQIVSVLAEPKIRLIKASQEKVDCNSTCNNSYSVNISLIISNLGIGKKDFVFEATVNFTNQSNHEPESGIIQFFDLATGNASNDSLMFNGKNKVFYHQLPIQGGTEALVSIIFKKFKKEKNERFNISYKLSPKNEFFRVNETTEVGLGFESEFTNYHGSSSDDFSKDEKIGLGVGLGLGILVIILVIIGVSKYKKPRRRDPNQI